VKDIDKFKAAMEARPPARARGGPLANARPRPRPGCQRTTPRNGVRSRAPTRSRAPQAMVPRADLDLANREIEELTTEIVQLQDEIQARPRPAFQKEDETCPVSTGEGRDVSS